MKKIILLRHGEVDIKNYQNISAHQFEEWIIEYNNADIKSDFSSKDSIEILLNETDIIICSTLKRSKQSIEIFNKTPFETDDVFNEAEIPFSNWTLLKLNPRTWLIFFRILWFFGYSNNCESFKQTKLRAKKATKKLIELSDQNKTVILVGHGMINRLIRKELILQKWNETKKLKSNNWDYGVFELKTKKDIRICYIGDSFVNGAGDPTKIGWTSRVSVASENEKIEITHYNLGIRRETSHDILLRWEDECKSRLPTVSENYVVFSFGVNDSVIEDNKIRVSLEDSVQNAKEILSGAKKQYKVIMIGPPAIESNEQNERIKQYNSSYQQLCKELKIPFLSIFERVENDKTWQTEVSSNDGAHPKEKGYKLLANFIKSWDHWIF